MDIKGDTEVYFYVYAKNLWLEELDICITAVVVPAAIAVAKVLLENLIFIRNLCFVIVTLRLVFY